MQAVKTDWVAYNNRSFFLTVLEDGKSKVKVLADSMSGRSALLSSYVANFPLYLYLMGRVRELCGISFKRTLILTSMVQFDSLISSKRPHLQMLSYCELDFHIGIGGLGVRINT